MNEEEFLKEFGEFQHLFDIVEEPSYSKAQLLSYEEKYSSSHWMVNSQNVHWIYNIQGFKALRDYIPDVDDWVYCYESFLRYGGDLNELKNADNINGQAYEDQEMSDSVESLISFLRRSLWH